MESNPKSESTRCCAATEARTKGSVKGEPIAEKESNRDAAEAANDTEPAVEIESKTAQAKQTEEADLEQELQDFE